jgi:hypothetical protein
MEETNYREIEAVNQSRLKLILKNPRAYQENKKIESDAFTFGSLVDFLLIEPTKNVEDYYFISKDLKVSDNVKTIVDRIFNYYEELKDFPEIIEQEGFPIRNSKLILQYAQELEYGQSWKPDTLVAKIEKEGSGYYHSLVQAKGKIKISEEDYSKAVNCKMAVMSDELLARYFKNDDDNKSVFKYVLSFDHERGFNCKGELDIVHIDKVNKVITPIDVKTTSDTVLGFNYNFWKYRYDFQAAFYRYGLKKDPHIAQLIEQGYKLEAFKFIVIEKELVNRPVSYWIPVSVDSIGQYGGTLSNGKELEGFEQALERLQWHNDNNLWEFPREYYINGQEFEILI